MTAFLDLLQTEKSNETYFKFIKYLEEDYDWLAFSLKNTLITSDEILEYNKTSSQSYKGGERERERERRMREARRREEEAEDRVRDQFRERESRGRESLSSSSPMCSPLHSSEFSLSSVLTSVSGDERLDTLSEVSSLESEAQRITEPMINFVMSNSIILRRWQSLAHGAGLSHRVEIIKARVRGEGGDLDQHVSELLREWMEVSPEKATLGGLVRLLRDQNFNDTALRLETGTYTKKR